jgi:hypothetical protein
LPQGRSRSNLVKRNACGALQHEVCDNSSTLARAFRGAAPKRSIWRTATFETIRCTFLKIAVRIEELKTRIKMALPSTYPHVQEPIARAKALSIELGTPITPGFEALVFKAFGLSALIAVHSRGA